MKNGPASVCNKLVKNERLHLFCDLRAVLYQEIEKKICTSITILFFCVFSISKFFNSFAPLYMYQARRKVLKVEGAIALEPAKLGGAKRRAMYLNLEIPPQKKE